MLVTEAYIAVHNLLAGKVRGKCYAASEALFHLSGGYDVWEVWRWRPPRAKRWHWYLRHKETGEFADLTAKQFRYLVPYEKGVKAGFLSKKPSKNAQSIIDQVLRAAEPRQERAV